eukprot:1183772-Prorocentrum_minimum.AAC.3
MNTRPRQYGFASESGSSRSRRRTRVLANNGDATTTGCRVFQIVSLVSDGVHRLRVGFRVVFMRATGELIPVKPVSFSFSNDRTGTSKGVAVKVGYRQAKAKAKAALFVTLETTPVAPTERASPKTTRRATWYRVTGAGAVRPSAFALREPKAKASRKASITAVRW